MAPFPWVPMLALSVSFLSNSYCISSLFAYLGYMMEHIGVADNKDEAGFYSGFVASAFMFGRCVSAYFWGRFADTYGRLPVVYISLATMAFVSIAFGLSTNLLWAVTSRFLLGAANGLVGVAKAMISEICGPEHELVGMTFLTATWALGYVIGPGFGGLLAEPAKIFPRHFSETGIFGRFPYLLPNLVGAGLALLGLCTTYLFLKETYHPGQSQRNGRDTAKNGCCAELVRPFRLLSEKRIRDVMIVYGIFSIVQISFPEVFPLWALSTVGSGGLDWTSQQIGQVLSMVGVLLVVFQLFIYPIIIKRTGVIHTQRWASLAALPLYSSIPMLSNLIGHERTLVVATTMTYFVVNSCAAAMFINISLVSNNLVETGRRGEINGLAMTINALGKSFGPFFFSMLFAWSIKHDRIFPLGSHLVFIIMSACVGIVAVYGWNIIRRDVDKAEDEGDKRVASTGTSNVGTERTKLLQSSIADKASEGNGVETIKALTLSPA